MTFAKQMNEMSLRMNAFAKQIFEFLELSCIDYVKVHEVSGGSR